MGYETKLIIGETSPYADKNGKQYFSVCGMIDLCKCGSDSEVSKIDWKNKTGRPVVYWYGYDGNKRVTKDWYDDMPRPVPILDVIRALEEDVQRDDYRRFRWALGMLRAMRENNGSDLQVLFFGH